MRARVLAIVAAALILGGCAYRGSEREKTDKETAQALGFVQFAEYLDPGSIRVIEQEATSKDGEALRRRGIEKDPNWLDPTRIDTTRFGKNIYRSSITPMVSEKMVFFGSMAVDNRIFAVVYGLMSKNGDTIAPWIGMTPSPEVKTLKEWSEDRNGLRYSFQQSRGKKPDETLCLLERVNAASAAMFTIVCAMTNDVPWPELEAMARTASIDGKVPAIAK